MAKSGQFRPGDFIRLNGFLRPVKSVPEAILPFCMNGESLNKVAMQRLIVATCMTAGQFFSLDLSAGHFTHVFIDEAGYCTEPETMVPTILLALGKGGQVRNMIEHGKEFFVLRLFVLVGSHISRIFF